MCLKLVARWYKQEKKAGLDNIRSDIYKKTTAVPEKEKLKARNELKANET